MRVADVVERHRLRGRVGVEGVGDDRIGRAGAARRSPPCACAMIDVAGPRSGSRSDFPTSIPCAARNVLAMPPPMTNASTRASKCSNTPTLSATLAPPIAHTNGCTGSTVSSRQRRELGFHQQAGVRGQVARHADGRRVRAVRGSEGIVDVEVAALARASARERRIVGLFPGVEAHVLEEHEAAVGNRARRGDGGRTDAVVDERDRHAETFARAAPQPGAASTSDRPCRRAGPSARG